MLNEGGMSLQQGVAKMEKAMSSALAFHYFLANVTHTHKQNTTHRPQFRNIPTKVICCMHHLGNNAVHFLLHGNTTGYRYYQKV